MKITDRIKNFINRNNTALSAENEQVDKRIKYIIDSYGSKTAVLFLSIIGFIYLIKLIVEKIFDNYILKKKKMEKKTQ